MSGACARGATFLVTNVADSGAGTLRAAITNANVAAGGSHVIAFSLAAPHRIFITNLLPQVVTNVLVDGSTQAGFTGTPLVVLSPAVTATSVATHGLAFAGRGGGVRALQISGFSYFGVRLLGTSNVIAGCWVVSNFNGVVTETSSRFGQIGGVVTSNRNVISANSGGLRLDNGDGHVVQGNFIGTSADGYGIWSNAQSGIWCESSNHVIGGSAAGARNVISGNGGNGIYCNAARGVQIAGNYIGTDAGGSNALPNATGIQMISGVSNIIGGGTTAHRNIIAGNTGPGVLLSAISYTGAFHLVQNNYIGLGAGGAALGNGIGINVQSSSNTIALNVISGNTGAGVTIISSGARGNVMAGNLVGTDPAGAARVPNSGVGVAVMNGARDNQIVGALLRNVISGNQGYGVQVHRATNNVISGNFIGTSILGTTAVSNNIGGFIMSESAGTEIAQNLIAGNGGHGVDLLGANNRDAAVDGNFIGLDVSGTNALPNRGGGVVIFGGSGHQIGVAGRNVIAGNVGNGIWLQAPCTNVTVAGNYIGVATNGTTARPNYVGMHVEADAVVGLLISNNVVAGNLSDGIILSGQPATNLAIVGNRVGVNSTATLAVTNIGSGIHMVGVSGARIGGTTAAERNVIAGYHGIRLTACGSNGPVVIAGNYIGLGGSGGLLTNWAGGQGGVVIEGSENVQVGGPSTTWRNVIGDNEVGVIVNSGTNNWIGYNYIGCDPSATLARPNGSGVALYNAAYSNLIENNIVAGNIGHGIELSGGPASNIVRANRIGYGSIAALPNGGIGVYLYNAHDNLIGGYSPTDGNRVAFNAGVGIMLANLTNTARNVLLANLVYSNAAPEIDLGGDGPTPNDPPPDADSGPNGFQNKPQLLFASAGATNISGKMAGHGVTLRLEFLARTPAAGAIFLGATNLHLPMDGTVAFSYPLPPSATPSGSVVVATATSAEGTSEFSDAIALGNATDSDGDLMPDWWEMGNFLNPAVSNAAASDADADGMTDIEEWIADTLPTDSGSVFRITAQVPGSPWSVRFPTSALRRYSLDAITSPTGSVWTILHSNIAGTGNLLELTDPTATTQQTYRARVRLP